MPMVDVYAPDDLFRRAATELLVSNSPRQFSGRRAYLSPRPSFWTIPLLSFICCRRAGAKPHRLKRRALSAYRC